MRISRLQSLWRSHRRAQRELPPSDQPSRQALSGTVRSSAISCSITTWLLHPSHWPVARQVHRDDVEVARQPGAQAIEDPQVHPPAVQQHQRRTAAAGFV